MLKKTKTKSVPDNLHQINPEDYIAWRLAYTGKALPDKPVSTN